MFWGEGDVLYLDSIGLVVGLHRCKHLPKFRGCTLRMCVFHLMSILHPKNISEY